MKTTIRVGVATIALAGFAGMAMAECNFGKYTADAGEMSPVDKAVVAQVEAEPAPVEETVVVADEVQGEQLIAQAETPAAAE